MSIDKAHPRLAAKGSAVAVGIAAVVALMTSPARSGPDEAKIVAEIDSRYQLAVKQNDAGTMDRILHEDFILVLGTGTAYTKADLLKSARERRFVYEMQDEEPGTQTVRVYGDTAVVTAKLILKATNAGNRVERILWFSDTYVRTPSGWRYAFGQASLPLPEK